ncbi:MAG: suppressor of fused domain protein [Cyanobacteria bacterium J06656_5]
MASILPLLSLRGENLRSTLDVGDFTVILEEPIFGDIGQDIYPLSAQVFNRISAGTIDPRWLTHSVFRCPPTTNRKTWAYVTSGMSNPWESETPEEFSGLGTEFLMETLEETEWAIDVMHTLMAYNLLLAAGKMGNFPSLNYGHRVPLALSESIKSMMFVYPHDFPHNFSIQSGQVDLIQVVGITPTELEFAKETSSEELKIKIINATGNLLTQRDRDSVV